MTVTVTCPTCEAECVAVVSVTPGYAQTHSAPGEPDLYEVDWMDSCDHETDLKPLALDAFSAAQDSLNPADQ